MSKPQMVPDREHGWEFNVLKAQRGEPAWSKSKRNPRSQPPDTTTMNIEDIDTIRMTTAELFPEEVAAGVGIEEIDHCAKVVGDLADAEGLVVVTTDVVKLLIRERAAARCARLRYGDIVQPGARVRIHPEPSLEPELPMGMVDKVGEGGRILVDMGDHYRDVYIERLELIP